MRAAVLLIILALVCAAASAASPIPAPKQFQRFDRTLSLVRASIASESEGLDAETAALVRMATARGVVLDDEAIPVRLQIAAVELPPIASARREAIGEQAYRIVVNGEGAFVNGASAAAVFHGIQTLDQLFDGTALPHVDITDWPDVPLRMLMVDAARQNENFDYYRRVIDFAARYKMNGVLCHLTDDQTSALHHEAYPELMHPRAWRTEDAKALVAYARERHVALIPEIESLGHSRMFERRADFADFLHMTTQAQPDESWMGTAKEGYTNVLCPASPKAAEYLDAMYARAAEGFDHPWLHVGLDEVDMTDCARCEAKHGKLSAAQWFARSVAQCRDLAAKHGKKTALWGDMLLAHREAVDALPREGTIIFDWNYSEKVTAESSLFFKEKGFEVVACPALMCAPHMVMPDVHNYENIAAFAKIARENDLLGVCTTIWIPQRYMSDVLWPGIAYAAAHSWSGSAWDESAFFDGYARDRFGIAGGADFREAWKRLAAVVWHRSEFMTACWTDEKSFDAAKAMAEARGAEIEAMIAEIAECRGLLQKVSVGTDAARRSDIAALEDSAQIVQASMDHLLAARTLRTAGGWDRDKLAKLDARCAAIIAIVERDWDRNRYADDPNKDGIHVANQHLLLRFKQMHAFHRSILDQP